MTKRIEPFKFCGSITANSSKSYAQRAFILSLLSNSKSHIFNSDESNDVKAIKKCIQQLGASIIQIENGFEIIPPAQKVNQPIELNVGESGLALRMLGIVATHFSTDIIINGEGTLLKRSQKHLIEVLKQLGLIVSHSDFHLPIHIRGEITNHRIEIDASESSQVLSGLILTLPLLEKDTEFTIKNIASLPYFEMTIDIMQRFGIDLSAKLETSFNIIGNQNYSGCEYSVEGDWSGAANHLVGAAISGEVELIGLNTNSKQSDKAILKALEKFGARIEIKSEGAKESIYISKNESNPFDFDITHCPDLFPILSILAAAAIGKSSITGIHRLENKESNRLISVTEMLNVFGVRYEIKTDTIEIFGNGALLGGKIKSYNDHRIAMAATVGASISDAVIEIDDSNCVKKSYPNFFSDLRL